MVDRSQHLIAFMENQTRFDLDQALEQWRKEIRQTGTVNEEQIVELESHLMESLAGLRTLGLTEEEAFWIARRRLGRTEQIADEFAKVHWPNQWLPHFTRSWKVFAWSGFALALFFFFLGSAALSYPGERFHQRVSLLSAISSALDLGLRANARVSFLPVVCISATALALFFRFAQFRLVRTLIIAASLTVGGAVVLHDVQRDFWVTFLGYLVSLPLLTIRVLAGREDGEFFQDGLVAGLAYGWWLLIWVVFAIRELLHWAAMLIARAERRLERADSGAVLLIK